jgi:GMP synthase (glutamine-hydrolysing)
MQAQVLILDFGSQYTQLIARTVRELGLFCEILPGTAKKERILGKNPKAIILSGGPASVNVEEAPKVDPEILNAGIPIFGICYGMQLLASLMGGTVGGWGRSASGEKVEEAEQKTSDKREFGPAIVTFDNPFGCFSDFKPQEAITAWMSHGDKVTKLPEGFKAIASSGGSPIAAAGDEKRKIYCVQFHPEVHHTPRGKGILEKFLFETVGLTKDWDSGSFIEETVARIKAQVPTGNVICALSGGVDSTVAAVLVAKAVGDRLHCIFVDNGLLRAGEDEEVVKALKPLGLNVTLVKAKDEFLIPLKGVTDPEVKRKTIGRVFIEVFEKEAARIKDAHFLVQGTLYPDVIESVAVVGQSSVIKSHHNVGGLIDNMKMELIEPLRELFKDEVRQIGRNLGVPEWFLSRHPFPGPGLAIRCLGEVTDERLESLKKADKIVREEIVNHDIQQELWQGFAVLLPVQSVGVMGDGRTYDECIALRLVTSRDGMTADWYYPPDSFLRDCSSRIVNETKGVNRVVLDISSKPPATIEWE